MRTLLVFLIFKAFSCLAVFSQSDAQTEWFMRGYPTLEKDGKDVMVSADEYIKHYLKGVKTKYKLIAVPDG